MIPSIMKSKSLVLCCQIHQHQMDEKNGPRITYQLHQEIPEGIGFGSGCIGLVIARVNVSR
jgi:hypothetical protein